MSDKPKDHDQTEPVCAPLIRLEATVVSEVGTSANGTVEDRDQTEPCAFAPVVHLQRRVLGVAVARDVGRTPDTRHAGGGRERGADGNYDSQPRVHPSIDVGMPPATLKRTP